MITIKNINEAHGDAIEFSAETVADAVDLMAQEITESFGDCEELTEGVDFEIVLND